MIKMTRAFNRNTTTRVYVVVKQEGYWDEDNEWVEGTESPPIPFNCTILPVDGFDEEGGGNRLHALPEGERVSSFFRITSTKRIPINSEVLYKEYKLKVIGESDYEAAGFYSVIAEDIRDKVE